jgi:hypothetical protein
MFFKKADYEGWTNWETWNTYLMLNNEQPMHEALNKIVRDGGTPQNIHDFAVQTVIADHNATALKDAQEWNSVPEDERVDSNYQDLLDSLGLDSIEDASDNVRKFHDLLRLGPDTADYTPDLIDPDLVNWQEIHERTAQGIWEDEAYDTPDQFNDEANPYLQDFVPDNPDDIKFSASIHQSLAGTNDQIYDTWTGLRLPWAKTANVDGAGPYLKRVLKQPGKKMMTDEGQRFLQFLALLGEEVDPLTPWLVSQYKKGDLKLTDNYLGGTAFVRLDQGDGNDVLNRDFIEKMAQWYNATDHPTRQSFNIQEMDLWEVVRQTEQHQQALEKEAELNKAKQEAIESDAETVYTFDNGYTVKKLDPEDLWAEGKLLGHCIGGHDYRYRLERGDIEVYSLRDPEGLPHVTWHYNDNEDGDLEELQGKSGEPTGEYRQMFEEWSNLNNKPTSVNSGLRYFNLGDIDNWWDFWNLYSGYGDGDYGLAIERANEQLHEDVEIDWGPVRVDDIVRDLFSDDDNTKENLTAEDLIKPVIEAGLVGEFIQELEKSVNNGEIDSSDPLLTPFKNLVEDFTDPSTGELVMNGIHFYDPSKRQINNPMSMHPDNPDYKRTPKQQFEKENLMPLFTEQQDWHSRLIDMRGQYPEDHPSWMGKPDFVYQIGQGDPKLVPWWDESGQSQSDSTNINWDNSELYGDMRDLVDEKGKVIKQEPWLGPASPYFDRYRHRFPEGPDFVQ